MCMKAQMIIQLKLLRVYYSNNSKKSFKDFFKILMIFLFFDSPKIDKCINMLFQLKQRITIFK